jgi:hypothetical protein
VNCSVGGFDAQNYNVTCSYCIYNFKQKTTEWMQKYADYINLWPVPDAITSCCTIQQAYDVIMFRPIRVMISRF